ncbi:MAG: hypothetical protein L0Y58_24195 [Verrucomicrobia subdivision 3 bacterium]|nr:hypothetical protein [Limisphaerales bacterium]
MKFTRQLIITFALLASAFCAHAFSLNGEKKETIGPDLDWQVPRIGYPDGLIGGPMFLGEGYRLNVPVVTYAYDQSFINYFGTNGMIALDRAIAILNDLPEVSTITNDGVNLYIRGQKVPKQTKFVNFEAQALQLIDIKQTALFHLMEEMGLAASENWVWALRSRIEAPGPITNYTVVKLNYDPITRTPSSYVNDTLYSYEILDSPNIADAFEFIVDPLGFGFNTVSSSGFFSFPGEFYTGLTHDDVGGLKYLYDTNNIVVETVLPTVTGGAPQAPGGGGGGSSTNISPWLPFFAITNVFGGTNVIGDTNVFTTNTLVGAAPRPGVNKVRFQRVAFDSIIGSTFVPITNLYTDVFFTNGRPMLQPVQRAISVPDFVFAVEDLGVLTPSGLPLISARTVAFVNNDPINGSSLLGGPGIIAPPIQITFTDLFPAFLNSNPFLDELGAINVGVWGSFDGSTNAPVVYPAGQNWSLDALRSLILGPAP